MNTKINLYEIIVLILLIWLAALFIDVLLLDLLKRLPDNKLKQTILKYRDTKVSGFFIPIFLILSLFFRQIGTSEVSLLAVLFFFPSLFYEWALFTILIVTVLVLFAIYFNRHVKLILSSHIHFIFSFIPFCLVFYLSTLHR